MMNDIAITGMIMGIITANVKTMAMATGEMEVIMAIGVTVKIMATKAMVIKNMDTGMMTNILQLNKGALVSTRAFSVLNRVLHQLIDRN
jgi:hypothetical protein